MELTVIWENFSCSDLACSDLAHFFYQILTFFTQHSQLRNLFSTHPNGTNSTKWNFYTLFHNNIHILTERIGQYPFYKFSINNDFSTLTLAQPKNHINIFKNQKSNATSQTRIQYVTFHQYTSFTKYLYLLRYRDISISTPHFFRTSKIDLFDLNNPKIQISLIPSSCIIPNLKWTRSA